MQYNGYMVIEGQDGERVRYEEGPETRTVAPGQVLTAMIDDGPGPYRSVRFGPGTTFRLHYRGRSYCTGCFEIVESCPLDEGSGAALKGEAVRL